jgi:hypothetical protein
MGLFDIFTGDPLKGAADKSRALFQQTQSDVTNRINATRDEAAGYLRGGVGNARGNLGQGYGAATGAIDAGSGSALGYLDAGTQGALGQLAQARQDLTANGGAFRPLAELGARFGLGSQLYSDALGLNGADGNARAHAAFTAGPGYQYQLDQGLDAVNRAANARGRLNSGNTDVDALKFGQGLANQTWQQWLGNLAPYNQLELSATSGAATGNAGIGQQVANLGVTGANFLNGAGQTKANVATGRGNTLADIATKYYGGLAGLDTSEGSALAGNATNATSAINSAALGLAPRIGQTYVDAANADMLGSKNLWGLGMQLANLGAGALGGGFGGLGASAGSVFGGQTGPTYANATMGAYGGVPFPIIGGKA